MTLINGGVIVSLYFPTLRIQHAVLDEFLVDLSDLFVEVSGALIEVFIVGECLQIIDVVFRKIIPCAQINVITVTVFIFILTFTVN
jgi:cell shape-determining protein MreD